jgi:hypothetical protein
MQTDQALWRIVTTLIIGSALLTVAVLMWIRIVAHQPAQPSFVQLGSAVQIGVPAPRASYDGPTPVMTPLPAVRPANDLPTLLGHDG